jgi:hypothetical protein
MSIPRRPLSELRNQPNGLAGLDSAGRMTAPVRGVVSILDFGADPTGVVACDAALANAIASTSVGSGWYVAGPRVIFPPGIYRFDAAIQLKRTVILEGSSAGLAGGQPTRFVFPSDSRGLIVHRYNTIGEGVESTPTTAADGTIIQGINFVGSGTDATKDGIWLRARAIMRDCVISGFGGHGIKIAAAAGGAPDIEGNANNWRIDNVRCTGNGEWGLFVDGPDVNAGTCISLDTSSNGSGGIWDSSFLGNTYIGCHTATNGSQVSGKNTTRNRTSIVWFDEMRYYAAPGATEQQLIDTQPGSNSAVWSPDVGRAAASATHPLWVAGQAVGRYFVSDQYRTDNPNARNLFLGCYEEGGYSRSTFALPTMIVGGMLGAVGGFVGGLGFQSNLTGATCSVPFQTPTAVIGFGQSINAGNGLQYWDTQGLFSWTFGKENGRWAYKWANLGGSGFISFYDRGATPANGYARDLSAANGALGVGDHYAGSPSQMRWRGLGTAAPTTGTWLRGDRVDNLNPSAGGYVGWVCTTAGTPGTWKGYGAIEP